MRCRPVGDKFRRRILLITIAAIRVAFLCHRSMMMSPNTFMPVTDTTPNTPKLRKKSAIPATSSAMPPDDTAARTTGLMVLPSPATASQMSPIQAPGLLLALRRHHQIVMSPVATMPVSGTAPSMPRPRKKKKNRREAPAERRPKLANDMPARETNLRARAWWIATSESSPIKVSGPEYADNSARCSRGAALRRVAARRAETATAATAKPSAVISLNTLPGRSSMRALSSSARASARTASAYRQ